MKFPANMATLTNIIKIRGRDALHFANGQYTRNMSQFWVGYVKDRKSLSQVPISSLKDEIFEYTLKVGEQINKQLAASPEWDGALYRTLEIAASYIDQSEVEARGLKEATADSKNEPAPTDRFQPMSCQNYDKYHGKFDHSNTSILEEFPGGEKIEVDEKKVLEGLQKAALPKYFRTNL